MLRIVGRHDPVVAVIPGPEFRFDLWEALIGGDEDDGLVSHAIRVLTDARFWGSWGNGHSRFARAYAVCHG
ncbi:hypothetical protein ACFPRL_16595 [Pseudoclavibacter helvolus]